MPVHDDLGLRMKTFYEQIPKIRLMRRCPVMLRIDGKAFHTFSKNFKKPFDEILIKSMQETMKYLCKNIQGCVFGYTQSDEITLILVDYKKLTSEAWFDYEVQKMDSVAASMATLAFNKYFLKAFDDWAYENFGDAWHEGGTNNPIEKEIMKLCEAYDIAREKGAMFDCRCFNVPKEEVTNFVYWRQLDATCNSIQMVGQANFSHKELQNKTCNQIQDMLFTQKHINWNDLPTYQKRGSCCIKTNQTTTWALQTDDGEITTGASERPHWIIDTEIPIFKGEGRDYIEKLIMVGE